MKEEKETKASKGSTMGKVRRLQKQYNKILVSLFDQFAAESIEEALESNEGAFGENIESIVQCALDCLKTKVMEELGIKGSNVAIAIDGIGIDLGGVDEDESHFEGETEEEHEEHEAEETPEEEAEEHAEGESEADEDDEDKPVGESTEEDDLDDEDDKPEFIKHVNRLKKMDKRGKVKKHKKSDVQPKEESVRGDKEISKSRRNDQVSLMEAYQKIYKK